MSVAPTPTAFVVRIRTAAGTVRVSLPNSNATVDDLRAAIATECKIARPHQILTRNRRTWMTAAASGAAGGAAAADDFPAGSERLQSAGVKNGDMLFIDSNQPAATTTTSTATTGTTNGDGSASTAKPAAAAESESWSFQPLRFDGMDDSSAAAAPPIAVTTATSAGSDAKSQLAVGTPRASATPRAGTAAGASARHNPHIIRALEVLKQSAADVASHLLAVGGGAAGAGSEEEKRLASIANVNELLVDVHQRLSLVSHAIGLSDAEEDGLSSLVTAPNSAYHIASLTDAQLKRALTAGAGAAAASAPLAASGGGADSELATLRAKHSQLLIKARRMNNAGLSLQQKCNERDATITQLTARVERRNQTIQHLRDSVIAATAAAAAAARPRSRPDSGGGSGSGGESPLDASANADGGGASSRPSSGGAIRAGGGMQRPPSAGGSRHRSNQPVRVMPSSAISNISPPATAAPSPAMMSGAPVPRPPSAGLTRTGSQRSLNPQQPQQPPLAASFGFADTNRLSFNAGASAAAATPFGTAPAALIESAAVGGGGGASARPSSASGNRKKSLISPLNALAGLQSQS